MPHFGEITDQTLQALGYRTLAQHIALGYRTEAELIAAQFCRIVTGTYTGDGTLNHAITDVGFRPKWIIIWSQGGGDLWVETCMEYADVSRAGRAHEHQGVLVQPGVLDLCHTEIDNALVSIDEDGFTVSDAGADWHPNTTGTVYEYLCLG